MVCCITYQYFIKYFVNPSGLQYSRCCNCFSYFSNYCILYNDYTCIQVFFLKKKFLGILIMFLKISIPFFISIIITIFHWVMIQKYSIIELTFKSILIQLLLWSVYIFILYRNQANTLLNTFRLKQKLPRRHEE